MLLIQTLAPLIGSYILKKISPGLIFDEFDVNSSRLSTESNMSKDNLEESTIRPVVETDDMRQVLVQSLNPNAFSICVKPYVTETQTC